MIPPFLEFPKMARLRRECIITEKLDGTNAQIYITETGEMYFGSRTRWITPNDDNFGFARWCTQNIEELRLLGPGQHFGEWWGCGIQRNYDMSCRTFSLFNTSRWCLHDQTPQLISVSDKRVEKYQQNLPKCCGLVPVLYKGIFDTSAVSTALERLKTLGSVAAPGFINPEGIVVYHTAANKFFKMTIKDDDKPKSA